MVTIVRNLFVLLCGLMSQDHKLFNFTHLKDYLENSERSETDVLNGLLSFPHFGLLHFCPVLKHRFRPWSGANM